MNLRYFAIGTVFASAIIAFVTLESRTADRARSEVAAIEAAEEYAARYRQIGESLQAILESKEQSDDRRARAARLIGRIRYAPAIPALIEHIGLVDPGIQVISGNETEPLAAVNALGLFQDAAVPQMLHAYLAEPDPVEGALRLADRRRQLLLGAILEGRSAKLASTLLHGLRAQGDKRVSEAKAEELLNYLRSR